MQSVFRSVWSDFYAWEQEYCRDAIQRLAASTVNARVRIHDEDSPQDVRSEDFEPHFDSHSAEEFEIVDYTATDPPTVTRLSAHAAQVDAALDIPPAPAYDSCTPSNRNIFTGDDPPYMQFMPFSDDPRFDHEDHAWNFKGFAWQRTEHDPDSKSGFGSSHALSAYIASLVDIIILEVARRLHWDLEMSLEDIDETTVLPQKLASTVGKTGFITKTRQRR